MKKPVLLDELLIWLRGRFTLTSEEKFWLLLVLIVIWVGLLGRYFYLRNQTPETAFGRRWRFFSGMPVAFRNPTSRWLSAA